jgi:hypothetical protein
MEQSRGKKSVGVVAQEIQQILPEAVAQRDNGYYAVEYEKLIPLLIESIKELRQEVTAKGNPIVGTHRREVGHIIASLNDFRMSHTIPFDEEAGKL